MPLADPCVLQHLLLTTRGVGTWWKEGMFHFKISEVHHIPLKFLNSPGDSGCTGLQQHRGPACLSCCGEVLLVSPGSSWGVEDHPEPPQVPLAGGLDAPTTQEGGSGLTAWKSLLETSAFHLPFLEFLERNVFCLAGERYSFLVKEEP